MIYLIPYNVIKEKLVSNQSAARKLSLESLQKNNRKVSGLTCKSKFFKLLEFATNPTGGPLRILVKTPVATDGSIGKKLVSSPG